MRGDHRPGGAALCLGRRSLAPRRVPRRGADQIAEADGFPRPSACHGVEAVWAIKGLPDSDLPLFAALGESNEPDRSVCARCVQAARWSRITAAPACPAPPSGGLPARGSGAAPHPDLRSTPWRCRTGRWAELAGLVLVRQRPG